jgi:hypothetical protein
MVWLLQKEETRALTGPMRMGENGGTRFLQNNGIYLTALHHVPKNCDLDIQHYENLKSHLEIVYEFLFGNRKGHPSEVIALTC